ncbi:dipeptidase [Hyphococcus lacteus]|uniref:Membrane dipeptidase n=1 Tax=Hyphococcus lacteus TaxID=3143536 RepID=A0ABV3Z2D9_9PROT
MTMTRRDAIRIAAGAAATFSTANAAQSPEKLKRLYDKAIVIDALSFGHVWDDIEHAAVRQSGYTGIITSLDRSDLQTAIDEIMVWKKRIKDMPDQYMMALSASDFERAKRENKLAVMMNFQNATMLEGEVDNIDVLHAIGMRCFQLTYNSRNLVGDGSTERTNVGLSDFGVDVVKRMNQIGVLVDVSHSGRQTTLDAVAFSEKPIAYTHTMAEALRPNHPRAKTDEQFKALAEKGGVAGIAALGYFIGKNPGTDTTIETYADHIEHAVKVAGYEHVALSTDFPVRGLKSWATKEEWYDPRLKFFKPSYDVQWPPYIPELDTPDRFRNVITVLDRRGWSTRQLENLLGGNWMRLFRDVFGS